jgi:prepilin-type N-terminal cleavage/methylation domain-containing protein
MNSSASVHRLPLRGPVRRRLGIGGFTLLELLAVIAIIAVLTGIVIGVGRRASESGKIARAKAELAVLSAALEAFRTQYGDYPQTGSVNFALPTTPLADSHSNVQLLFALTGHRHAKGELASPGRSFIELAKFSTQEVTIGMGSTSRSDQERNALVDPWGNRYVYYYRTSAAAGSWKNPSYVLYSVGPDGAKALSEDECHFPPREDGSFDLTATNSKGEPVNADNIYANR